MTVGDAENTTIEDGTMIVKGLNIIILLLEVIAIVSDEYSIDLYEQTLQFIVDFNGIS
jgi:hypothetical protein